jgi:uncharacterized protein
MFGLLDAYILLWNGDILVTYALAGALLYLLRNRSAKTLFFIAATLIALMSLLHFVIGFGLKDAFDAHQRVVELEVAGESESISERLRDGAAVWDEFVVDFEMSKQAVDAEVTDRTKSYASAFTWNAKKNNELYLFVSPAFLLWDALAMMLLGMALYKTGVLQATRSIAFYKRLMLSGFSLGLLINGYEVYRAYSTGFDIFMTFAQMQPTYHLGRLGIGLGYIGLLGWIVKRGYLQSLTSRLTSVGRMALTNYLMHSFICAIIFTGLGFGLLGQLQRVELYVVVIAIWLFQLWLSPIWLKQFRFGPVEWLWRTLTYGKAPAFNR